jgi:hypothetical protein
VYYSYGIPIYQPFGRMNWFHLSNVLPLDVWGVPLSVFDKLKLSLLGVRIKRHFKHAEIISAESEYSLRLISNEHSDKCCVSVNGSDEEIMQAEQPLRMKENVAIILGTYRYKALADSYAIFKMLQNKTPELTLEIVGDQQRIPSSILRDPSVLATGWLTRPEVIRRLERSRYYISTTLIENSYNAASEGIFFAEESFISDIGPHRELLQNQTFETITIPSLVNPLFHIKRNQIDAANLKNWDQVIREMLDRVAQ